MPRTLPSSRRRFRDYLARFDEQRRKAKKEQLTVTWHGEKSRKRSRSFGVLFREFLKLVKPYRVRIGFALATLTVSTTLGLVSPAATKVVIDNVLGGAPLTGWWERVLGPIASTRTELLGWLAGVVVAVSAFSVVVGISGRFQATRTVKLLQTAMRRRAFRHEIGRAHV